MKKILLTGGNGYLGSVMASYLLENGYECIVHDTGYFEDCLLFPFDTSYKIIKGDMCEFDYDLLNEIDVVVHLSGISNDPLKGLDVQTFYDPTRIYSIDLAKRCKSSGIKFIFASSCSIYGLSNTETALDEDSEKNPQTPYSVNKMQIEEDLIKISDTTFAPIILRFSTAFGLSPRLRFDLIINMFAGMAFCNKKITLNSNGKAWRPIVHIKDICKAVKCSIEYENELKNPLILNVGSNSMNYTILEIAEIVKNSIPGTTIEFLDHKNITTEYDEIIKDRKVPDGIDNRTYRVNFDKISKLFPEFNNHVTVESGVEEMVNKFYEINLSNSQFTDINYYRLQKMEYLLINSKIDKNLKWS